MKAARDDSRIITQFADPPNSSGDEGRGGFWYAHKGLAVVGVMHLSESLLTHPPDPGNLTPQLLPFHLIHD